MIPFRNIPKPGFPPIHLLLALAILSATFEVDAKPLEVNVIKLDGESSESRAMTRAREANGSIEVDGVAYEISWVDEYDPASTDFSIIMDNSRAVYKGRSGRRRNRPAPDYLERIAREVRGRSAAILFISGNILGDRRMNLFNRNYSDIIVFANGRNSFRIALQRVISRRLLIGATGGGNPMPVSSAEPAADSPADSTPEESDSESEGLTDLSEFIDNSINRNLASRMESIEKSLLEKLGGSQGGFPGGGAPPLGLSFSNPVVLLSSIFLGLLFLIVIVLFVMVGKLKYIGRNIESASRGKKLNRNDMLLDSEKELYGASAYDEETDSEETTEVLELPGRREPPPRAKLTESVEEFTEADGGFEEMEEEELPDDVAFTETDEELPGEGEEESLEEMEPEELPADVEFTESDEDLPGDADGLEEIAPEELSADVELVESDDLPEEIDAEGEDAEKKKKKEKKESESQIDMDDDDIPEF